MDTLNLTLADGRKIIAPEQVDITKVEHSSELEFELWETIKLYLKRFGIKLVSTKHPDYTTVKIVQDKIIALLKEAGVNLRGTLQI